MSVRPVPRGRRRRFAQKDIPPRDRQVNHSDRTPRRCDIAAAESDFFHTPHRRGEAAGINIDPIVSRTDQPSRSSGTIVIRRPHGCTGGNQGISSLRSPTR
jgi:hypothetical protein